MKILCLADEEGVKGFEIPSDQIVFAKLRARREREKNSILFKVDLLSKQRREIRELLDKDQCRQALDLIKTFVKKNGKSVDFPTDLSAMFCESWKKIPHYNPFE